MADPSILIVADDAALSLRLEQMLPRLGYAAEGPCRPGADALRADIERQPAAAVIAATDAQEGLAAAEALYAQAHLPSVLLGNPAPPPDNQPWPAASLPAAFSEGELAVALELARYRRSLEQAHREVAARYRTLFEASGDALMILDQGLIVDANARLRQLFAAAQEDLVGKTPFDFSPPTQPGGQPSIELGMHYIQQALAGQPQRFEWRHQRATGEPLDVDVLLLRIDINGKPHLQCILRDSAERHQLEQELREREARLRIITEHMHDLVSTCDLNGQYVYVSPSHQRLLGYLPDQIVGHSVFEYLHPDDLIQAVTKFQQGLLTLEQDSIECRYLHTDGHYVWLEIIGRPMLNDAGQMIGVVFSARDITERWQARQSLQESNTRLTAWVQELEQRNLRNTQLSEMIGFIQSSHTMTDACQVMAQSLGQIFAGSPGAVYITQPGPAGELQAAAEWAAAGPNTAPLPAGGGARLTFAKPECWAMRRMQLHSTPPGKHQLRCTHIDRGASLRQPPAANLEDYAYICAPMAVDGETLGVLHLQTGGEQLAQLEQAAAVVAERLALALANLKLRERLREQAIRDPLTGLFNRRYMEETLERELRRGARHQRPVGVVMLDIDYFKSFNDRFSYAAGDALLRELGALLETGLRKGDVCCRYGGEEFILILPEAALEDICRRAEQLRLAMHQLRVRHGGQPLGAVTISLGVAAFPEHGDTVEQMLSAVDTALHQAKLQRDCVVVAAAKKPAAKKPAAKKTAARKPADQKSAAQKPEEKIMAVDQTGPPPEAEGRP